MADNIALKNDDVTTIATLRTDEISSVHFATTKLTIGADGTDDGFVSSANPLPVTLASNAISGTVAATQSGTWNVTNVSGTVSLPTGASTAAKQPALGTAGTASADVLSIQGIASMTPIQVGDNSGSLTVDDGGTTLSVDDGGGVLTVDGTVTVQDGGGSLTVDGTVAVTDGGGSLTVDGTVTVIDGGGSVTVDGIVSLATGSAIIGRVGIDQTTPGTTNLVALAANQSVNVTQFGGVNLPIDNDAFVDGTTRLAMAGFVFDEVAGTSLTENDNGAARIDAKRAQVFTLEDATTRGQRQAVTADGAALVQVVVGTAGGSTPYSLIGTNSTNATVVKASAGKLISAQISNANGSVRYVKVYDKATTPSESDTPIARWAIPASSANYQPDLGDGIAFANGIAFRTVTGIADSNTTAVAADEIIVNLQYK
jgi:hypothetical protein